MDQIKTNWLIFGELPCHILKGIVSKLHPQTKAIFKEAENRMKLSLSPHLDCFIRENVFLSLPPEDIVKLNNDTEKTHTP